MTHGIDGRSKHSSVAGSEVRARARTSRDALWQRLSQPLTRSSGGGAPCSRDEGSRVHSSLPSVTLPYCEQECLQRYCSRECSTLTRRAELVRTHYAGRLCPSPAVAARARANSNECKSDSYRDMFSHSEEARALRPSSRSVRYAPRGRPLARLHAPAAALPHARRLPLALCSPHTGIRRGPRTAGRLARGFHPSNPRTRRGCVRRDEGEYHRSVPGGACGDSATARARTARGVVRARGFASEGDGIHGERRRHRRSRWNDDHFGGRPRADGAADGSSPRDDRPDAFH